MGAVAQMPDRDFAQECAAPFQVLFAERLKSLCADPIDVGHDGVEDALKSVVFVGPIQDQAVPLRD